MSAHMVESTCEIQAFIKGDAMSGSEKDAGFCSGGDEDDMSGLHSPSASEDSVEVQVSPISLRNKRKLVEPRKVHDQTAPLKKRRFDRLQLSNDEELRTTGSSSPFRPWSSSKNEVKRMETDVQVSSRVERRPEDLKKEQWLQGEERRRREQVQRRHEVRIQEEVLARLHESEVRCAASSASFHTSQRRLRLETPPVSSSSVISHPRLQEEPLALVLKGEPPRVPVHPGVSDSFERPTLFSTSEHHSTSLPHVQNHRTLSNDHPRHQPNTSQQRNYKNMTRERRIEANARERTRVHTISAAFDTLRRSIPAYSHNQKLSKLSVLRIACSYIMTLSKIANSDGSDSSSGPNLSTCVDLVSRTIQTEGKLRKKKDD
ncbi:uncharacterized protein net [Chelonus insularis]|uniref:uncharacterized protein net n=1 Tax=Chelonus insularis TaxID=460826 RepID=UPI00158BCE67|nr:uncharacterized protein LOC118074869 [Chelonus insularis]